MIVWQRQEIIAPTRLNVSHPPASKTATGAGSAATAVRGVPCSRSREHARLVNSLAASIRGGGPVIMAFDTE